MKPSHILRLAAKQMEDAEPDQAHTTTPSFYDGEEVCVAFAIYGQLFPCWAFLNVAFPKDEIIIALCFAAAVAEDMGE